ncbi:hypothetical protein [Dysgonomonas sp. ZJ279]|nr:hypothetical protein [Dysgonomonas sp. ZJ279]
MRQQHIRIEKGERIVQKGEGVVVEGIVELETSRLLKAANIF